MTRSFRSITLLFVSVAFLGVAGIMAWKGYEKYRKKERVVSEVVRLREEADRIRLETERLDERIAYMRTPEYAEREVKEKLNLKKPEESVAVVRSGIEKKREEDIREMTPVSAQPLVKTDENNPEKWWEFFFVPHDENKDR